MHYARWYKENRREPCSIEGCDRPRRAREWCNTHYERWRLHGDADGDRRVIDMAPGTPIERLMRRVTVTDSGCWEYGGSRINTGYGMVVSDGHHVLTHRLSYEHFVGPIPDGLVLDHLCRNRPCCNPAHLEPVTVAENNRRAAYKRDLCKRGHPLDEENTYVNPSNGMRQCRTCRKLRRDPAWSREG
jgi:hypothetical protein